VADRLGDEKVLRGPSIRAKALQDESAEHSNYEQCSAKTLDPSRSTLVVKWWAELNSRGRGTGPRGQQLPAAWPFRLFHPDTDEIGLRPIDR